MNCYLGVDIGTSGCKAAVFDADMRQVAEPAYCRYPIISPAPGFAELDSERVMQGCFDVIKSVAQRTPGTIRTIAVSSQGEAFTAVDGEGRALNNAMISSDVRAADLAREFIDEFGAERLYRITGHTGSGMFSLFKIMWLKQFRRSIFDRARYLLCFEDLLALRLGIAPAMGYPLAARTMLFDVACHRWSAPILAAAEIPVEKLARPLPCGTVAGVVPDGIAAALDLPKAVQWVAGGHDQVVGALGAGVCAAGSAMYAAGSVECICPVVPELVRSAELFAHNLCSYDYAVPGLYTSVAYSLTGSNLLQYFHDELTRGASYEALLDEMPEMPTDLLVLPYFTMSGTPYFDARTPAAVWGWRLTTRRGELLKGLLEGVTLEMKLNLELLETSQIRIDRLIATGGGCRNPRAVQLKADVLNRPIDCLEIHEAGCRGAALLGCAADTERPLSELATCLPRPVMRVQPDARRAAQYETRLHSYRKFYNLLKTFVPAPGCFSPDGL